MLHLLNHWIFVIENSTYLSTWCPLYSFSFVLKKPLLLFILCPHILPASISAGLYPPASLHSRFSPRLLSERGGVEVDVRPIHKDVSHREGMENAIRLFQSSHHGGLAKLQLCGQLARAAHNTCSQGNTHTWRCSTHLPDSPESRKVMHTRTKVATPESI